MEPLKLNLVGTRVSHSKFGLGTVVLAFDSPNVLDRAIKRMPPIRSGKWSLRSSNGTTRYTGVLNVGVKFDKGGPMGWAEGAPNDSSELQVV